jgi:hypothetical protein
MADIDALRPLLRAAMRQDTQAARQQEQDQETPASQQEQVTSLRTKVEATLSPPVRQALDLHYEWDDQRHLPRAVFWLQAWTGPEEWLLFFSEQHNVWVIREPSPLEALGVYGSQALERGLLVAIGDFLKQDEEIP